MEIKDLLLVLEHLVLKKVDMVKKLSRTCGFPIKSQSSRFSIEKLEVLDKGMLCRESGVDDSLRSAYEDIGDD